MKISLLSFFCLSFFLLYLSDLLKESLEVQPLDNEFIGDVLGCGGGGGLGNEFHFLRVLAVNT